MTTTTVTAAPPPLTSVRAAPFQNDKLQLINALKTMGANYAVITYSGKDGLGNITSVNPVDTTGKPMSMACLTVELEPAHPIPLHDALHNFTCEVLATYHRDYPLGDGAHGTLAFDLAEETVQLTHLDRVTGETHQEAI